MRDRMTPEQLAAARAQGQRAKELNQLAVAANGHGVSRADKARAQQELDAKVGSRQAKKLKEEALRRNGARPRGLSRLFS